MCCFSRPVVSVHETNIFARGSTEDRQFVVYSMTLKSDDDLAMILPLPVPKNVAEDAVKFISLEKYPDFFADFRKPRFPCARILLASAGPARTAVPGLSQLL